MTNETYRIARQAILQARAGRRSRCLLFVRPSNQGKSHTAFIIVRDFQARIIPAMSITEQRTWFADRLDDPIFIFDDPSDWYRKDDRAHVFSILKNIYVGYLKSGRATKYDVNIPVQIEKKSCTLFFMNTAQYNSIRGELEYTGLGQRLEVYFTKHDQKTLDYIDFEYDDNGYSSGNLPRFKLNGDLDKFDVKFLKSNKDGQYYNEVIEFVEE